MVQHQPLEVLSERHACIPHGEGRLFNNLSCQLPGSIQYLLARHNFVDDTEGEGFRCRQFLSSEQEIPATVRT